MIFPYKPTKNQSFTIFLDTNSHNVANSTSAINTGSPWTNVYISKDGAKFVDVTNTPTYITKADDDVNNASNGFSQLDLTSAEMNADKIIVVAIRVVSGTTHDYSEHIIYTVAGQPISLADAVIDVNAISTSNPTLQEVLSMLWLGMTRQAVSKGWSLATWLKKFSF